MTEAGALLIEPCPRCGRDQTIVVTPSESRAVCICCGGGPLARDKYCRHHGESPELPMLPRKPEG